MSRFAVEIRAHEIFGSSRPTPPPLGSSLADWAHYRAAHREAWAPPLRLAAPVRLRLPAPDGASGRAVAMPACTGKKKSEMGTAGAFASARAVAALAQLGEGRRDGAPPSGLRVGLQAVIAAAAAYFNVTRRAIRSAVRIKPLVRVRHIVMWLGRRVLNKSFPRIGVVLGGRDHTTVLHGVRKIDQLILSDARLRDDLDQLSQILQATAVAA